MRCCSVSFRQSSITWSISYLHFFRCASSLTSVRNFALTTRSCGSLDRQWLHWPRGWPLAVTVQAISVPCGHVPRHILRQLFVVLRTKNADNETKETWCRLYWCRSFWLASVSRSLHLGITAHNVSHAETFCVLTTTQSKRERFPYPSQPNS